MEPDQNVTADLAISEGPDQNLTPNRESETAYPNEEAPRGPSTAARITSVRRYKCSRFRGFNMTDHMPLEIGALRLVRDATAADWRSGREPSAGDAWVLAAWLVRRDRPAKPERSHRLVRSRIEE